MSQPEGRIAPVAGQYSKAVVNAGTVYLAGLIAEDWEQDIVGQTSSIFAQIEDLLGSAGTTKSRLLSLTVFLRTFDDYPAFKAAYADWIDRLNLPARATVQADLLDPRIRIEIVATAACAAVSDAGNATAAGRVAAARSVTRSIAVDEALTRLDSPAHLFVDVREDSEWAAGHIPGAIHAPRGSLEFALDPTSSLHRAELDGGRTLVMVCGSGGRAALACRLAQQFGYNAVYLDGGMKGWRAASGPRS